MDLDIKGLRVLVTAGAGGIGLAIARAFAREGSKVHTCDVDQMALSALAASDPTITTTPCDVSDRSAVKNLFVDAIAKLGGLDVLVNNAGIGIGATATDHQAKHVDLQLGVNVRAVILLYRESIEMLRAAGAEHGGALVVNLASLAGRSPQPWLSVYSATKAAVIAYTTAMNKELNSDGVKSVALCPGFVDTDMSDFIKGTVSAEEMITTADIAEALRFLLRLSRHCIVPEIVFQRPGEAI
jgi:NAD(P)-dependent dehydrogenase (short-subunit alcohol dehydrogenase family)